jgi:hypothetical protein
VRSRPFIDFSGRAGSGGLTFLRFLKTLDGFADKKYSWDGKFEGYTYKTFYILGMHFMDAYNYDLERVSRCGVHYSAPDGRIYPFCTQLRTCSPSSGRNSVLLPEVRASPRVSGRALRWIASAVLLAFLLPRPNLAEEAVPGGKTISGGEDRWFEEDRKRQKEVSGERGGGAASGTRS